MQTTIKNIRKNENIASRVVDEQALVIMLENTTSQGEKITIFNKTGTRIWDLIDENKDQSEIIKIISKEYDGQQSDIEKEVKEFLKNLEEKKLIYYDK